MLKVTGMNILTIFAQNFCLKLGYDSATTTSAFPPTRRHHTPRASDFFQDWWAEVTHGAKHDGSFSEMMGPRIAN